MVIFKPDFEGPVAAWPTQKHVFEKYGKNYTNPIFFISKLVRNRDLDWTLQKKVFCRGWAVPRPPSLKGFIADLTVPGAVWLKQRRAWLSLSGNIQSPSQCPNVKIRTHLVRNIFTQIHTGIAYTMIITDNDCGDSWWLQIQTWHS